MSCVHSAVHCECLQDPFHLPHAPTPPACTVLTTPALCLHHNSVLPQTRCRRSDNFELETKIKLHACAVSLRDGLVCRQPKVNLQDQPRTSERRLPRARIANPTVQSFLFWIHDVVQLVLGQCFAPTKALCSLLKALIGALTL